MSASPTVLFSDHSHSHDHGDSKQLDELKKTDEEKKRHKEFRTTLCNIESSRIFSEDDILKLDISELEIYYHGQNISVISRYTEERVRGILLPADSDPYAVYYCYDQIKTEHVSEEDRLTSYKRFIVKISENPNKPLITLFTQKGSEDLYTIENQHFILFSGQEVRLVLNEDETRQIQGKGYSSF